MDCFQSRIQPVFLFLLVLPAYAFAAGSALPQTGQSQMRSTPLLEVPEVMVQDSPGNTLLEDPIAQTGNRGWRNPQNESRTSVSRTVADQIALPVSNFGNPGSPSQLRGLGQSSEEVNVQTLGISLNPAQGGGFDLSSFPNFIWESINWRSGPQLGASDIRSASGTLKLDPWTSGAVRSEPEQKLGGLYSQNGIYQTYGGTRAERFGLLFGQSFGTAQKGFSGSASLKNEYSGLRTRVHFLGSSLDTQTPGPLSFQTPDARLKTNRWIPIAELQKTVGKLNLQSAFYFDQNEVSYQERPTTQASLTRGRQWGATQAASISGLRLGASFRRADLSGDFLPVIQENTVQVFGSKLLTWSLIKNSESSPLLLLEPQVRGVLVTGFGALPETSLGAALDWQTPNNLAQKTYIRSTLSHRIPSLIDRYFYLPNANQYGFSGNPLLKPERIYTQALGHHLSWFKDGGTTRSQNEVFGSDLKLQYSLRDNAIAPQTFATAFGSSQRLVNQGQAWILSLESTQTFSPGGKLANQAQAEDPELTSPQGFQFFETTTFTRSLLTRNAGATGLPASRESFAYLPSIQGIVGSAYAQSLGPNLMVEPQMRFRWAGASLAPQFGGASLSNPGYGLFDSWVNVSWRQRANLSFRVENLFNKQIQLIRDFPLPGRTYSLAASVYL